MKKKLVKKNKVINYNKFILYGTTNENCQCCIVNMSGCASN
ncbi:unknown [Coprobacillus sp. CAG:698]|nr:unknown [Coprobacillus sp. CAG:698]